MHGVGPTTLRELRDHALVALLLGCGLRRGEALGLAWESIQQRDEHWVIADLVGKAGHIRTVPVPRTTRWARTRSFGLTNRDGRTTIVRPHSHRQCSPWFHGVEYGDASAVQHAARRAASVCLQSR
ncbi:MAG: tyrosine-type recombinase/integrase [Acidobacteriota bacterium]